MAALTEGKHGRTSLDPPAIDGESVTSEERAFHIEADRDDVVFIYVEIRVTSQ